MLMDNMEDGVHLCRGCGLGISRDGSVEVCGMQKEVIQTWETRIKLA